MKLIKSIKFIFVLLSIILLVSGCSYSISVSSGVASMAKSAKTKETSNNMASFELKKGEKLKIDYKSSVKEGTLKLQLRDPDHKVIEEFEINKSGKKEITAETDGEYAIFANYEDFIGSFKIHAKK